MNIIAYGSLLNQASLQKTLQRPAALTPIQLSGFQRIFNAPFGPYAFLNITPTPSSTIQAAYFSLTDQEVKRFSQREKGSDLIQVLPNFFAFVWPQGLCQELPVLQSYINVCQSGSQQLGINLWQGTKQPSTIINDHQHPLYT